MDDKRGYVKTILTVIIAILVVTIIGTIMYFYYTYETDPFTAVVDQVTEIFDNQPTDDSDADYTPEQLEIIQSSSSSSGGGGSSSSSSSGAPSCYNDPINYYMINAREKFTCLNYDGEICIEKFVNCSIDVQNRDNLGVGYFNIRLIFVERGKEAETDGFGPIERSFTLDPMEIEKFGGTNTITSSGVDGLANKEINCYFNTLREPYKIIC